MKVKKKKPLKVEHKKQERTAKTIKFNHLDIKYAITALALKEAEGGIFSYRDLFVDWYLCNLNYIERFGMSITGKGQTEGVPEIDRAFALVKRKLENKFPNSIIIFQYTTKFSNDSTKDNSGCKINLAIHLKEMQHINHRSKIKAHIPECIEMIDEINKEVKDLFAV